MIRLLTLVIFAFTCCLYAEDDTSESDPFTSSLASTQSLLPTIVQSVSTVSGEWLNFATDLVVAGPEAIVLNRTYSPNSNKNSLGYHWDFNREHSLKLRKNYIKKKWTASYKQSSGVTTIHQGRKGEDKSEPISLFLHERTGLTNCRMGEISGRTNLNNTLLLLDPKKNHCTALSGSGNITYYKFSNKKQDLNEDNEYHHYKPDFERKANGNILSFKKGGIQAYNPEETLKYGWIKMHSDSKRELLAEASDGKQVRYTFNCKPKEGEEDDGHLIRYSLSEVSSSHKPTERYEYALKYRKKDPFLKVKHLPDNRFQAVKYYKMGHNKLIGLKNVHIESNKDFRYHRVRKILAPVGIDPTPIVTHQFVYHGEQDKKKVCNRKTDVYDAYLRKTTYEFNDELRPKSVKRFDREGKLYSSDHFVWDDYRYYPDFLDPRNYLECIDWTGKFSLVDFGLDEDPPVTRGYTPNTVETEKIGREHSKKKKKGKKKKKIKTKGTPPTPSNPFASVTRNPAPNAVEMAEKAHEQAKKRAAEKKEKKEGKKRKKKKPEAAPPGSVPFYRGVSPLPKQLQERLKDPSNEVVAEAMSEEKLFISCLRTKTLRKRKRNHGNLNGKYLQDANGNILHGQFFSYDNRGNILEETFYGNLSGKNHTTIRLTGNQTPADNGVERYSKRYTYSDDRFNLLLTEEEDNGKGLENVYYEDSPLIKAKYVKECGRIVFRQFYFYDSNTTLIKSIKDDGCERDAEDLSGVHERHITLYQPRQQAPFGIPEAIEERYWDHATGQELLLRRRICSYSREGHLEREEHFDANGSFTHCLSWTYNPHGFVIEHVNALGQISKKDYDLNDNMIFEEELGIVKTHTYDYANRLINTVEQHPDAPSFSISHRYDYIGNRIATIDRFGNETQFEYDDFNRLVKTILPPLCDDEGRVTTPILETLYNEADRPIAKTDPNGHQTRTSYNARGSSVEVIYPDETVDRYYYALDGSLAESIAPNGTKTVYRRDSLGRVLEQNIYDQAGQLLTQELYIYQGTNLSSKIDAEGRTTTYHYDGAGRLIRVIIAGQTVSYQYDASSRISKITKGTNPEELQTFIYDNFNRVQEERQENSAGEVIEQTFFVYDDRGNIIETIKEGESGRRTVRSRFDSFNQLIETIDGEQHATHLRYDYTHRNAMGQFVLQIIETDPLGRQTYQIHNALGHLCEVIKKDPFGTLAAQQTVVNDATGKILKTIDAVIIDGKIDRHLFNIWQYHPSGQEELIIESATTPLQKITRFRFNQFSQKEQVIKPSGVRLYYFYDLLGRVIHTTSSDRTIDYRYTYNRCHQICSIEDAIASTQTVYEYDSNGRIQREHLAHGYALSYRHDSLGRTTEVILPDQSAIHYRYDSSLLKKVERIKQNEVVYAHTYDRHDLTGALTQSTLPRAAGTVHYRYDRNGRVTALNHRHLHYQVSDQGYDPVGRLTALSIEDSTGKKDSCYQYNTLDHLVSEQGQQNFTYQTDSIHNRLEKNGLKYQVNVLNQLEQQGNCTYRYDANGNIIEKNEDGVLKKFAYDALDRLITVATQEKTIHYRYDGLNRRIAKIDNGTPLYYLYQGQNEIGAIDHTGEIVELRILGAGVAAEIGSTLAIELRGKVYAPLHDLLGHITSLIDADSGEVAESYRYTAFGEETLYDANGTEIKTTAIGNPWRFASKRVDAETGWIYFGKRYYDPELGRWTTPDPASFIDGPNLYSYLKHNPIKSYDAYGLYSEAYAQSCEVGANAGSYAPSSHEHWSDERSEVGNQTTHYAAHERQVKDLPDVVHCHGFEKVARCFQSQCGWWGWYNATFGYTPSGDYHLGRRDIQDKLVCFVNGMNTSFNLARQHAEYISDLEGGINVHFMYNATHGSVMNLTECIMGNNRIATEPVREIHASLNKFFDTASANATALVICNSQGAIHVSNALLSYNEELRNRVNVLAISPGGYILPETCNKVTHYRAELTRDFIPYIDQAGAARARETITTLPSHPDAPWFDHSFQSPTYRPLLRDNLNEYINN